MNLFVKIHDRKTDIDTELSMAQLASYKPATVTDLNGSTHICIIYKTNFGLIYEEEFDNTSDRDDKIEILEEYSSTGGGGANLQIKDVIITENGDSVINPDSGYDGLKKVNVTTNVSGGGGSSIDWSQIGYSSEPAVFTDSFNYAKSIYDNWDPSITSMSSDFMNDYRLTYFPNVDVSNVTSFSQAFSQSSLIYMPALNYDFSKVTSTSKMFQSSKSLVKVDGDFNFENSVTCANMFNGCDSLETVGSICITNSATTSGMFAYCKSLKNIGGLTVKEGITKISIVSDMFKQCDSLTNDSLNKILAFMQNLTEQTTKTLASFGISASQATVCQTLSNWTALQSAGWTTGY